MSSSKMETTASDHLTAIFLGFMIVLSIFSCNSLTEPEQEELIISTPFCDGGLLVACDLAKLDPEFFDSKVSDDFTIEKATWNGVCLSFEVMHGGGCDLSASKFELLARKSLNSSSVNDHDLDLRLVLKNEDPCEALVNRTIKFNLNNTFQDWDRTNPIAVYISDWGSVEIEYTVAIDQHPAPQ